MKNEKQQQEIQPEDAKKTGAQVERTAAAKPVQDEQQSDKPAQPDTAEAKDAPKTQNPEATEESAEETSEAAETDNEQAELQEAEEEQEKSNVLDVEAETQKKSEPQEETSDAAKETGAIQAIDAQPAIPLDELEETGRVKKRRKGGLIPRKGDSAKEIVRKSIFLVSIITIVVCLGIIGNEYVLQPWLAGQEVDEIAGKVGESNSWEDAEEKYPGITFPEGMQLKYADLYAENPDLRGWIVMEDLGINHPIVQRNNYYYLDHAFDGSVKGRGTLFFDENNNTKDWSRNTTVYGHNLNAGDAMFGNLTRYEDLDQFRRQPTIQCNTLYKDDIWKIYGVYYTNGKKHLGASEYMLDYIFSEVKTDENFMEYIAEVDRRKLYTTGVDIQPDDKILTLSTCAYIFEDARFVVVARLVREGEDPKVDTDLAKWKDSSQVQYPEAYYRKHNRENPFRDFEYWQPLQ